MRERGKKKGKNRQRAHHHLYLAEKKFCQRAVSQSLAVCIPSGRFCNWRWRLLWQNQEWVRFAVSARPKEPVGGWQPGGIPDHNNNSARAVCRASGLSVSSTPSQACHPATLSPRPGALYAVALLGPRSDSEKADCCFGPSPLLFQHARQRKEPSTYLVPFAITNTPSSFHQSPLHIPSGRGPSQVRTAAHGCEPQRRPRPAAAASPLVPYSPLARALLCCGQRACKVVAGPLPPSPPALRRGRVLCSHCSSASFTSRFPLADCSSDPSALT